MIYVFVCGGGGGAEDGSAQMMYALIMVVLDTFHRYVVFDTVHDICAHDRFPHLYMYWVPFLYCG